MNRILLVGFALLIGTPARTQPVDTPAEASSRDPDIQFAMGEAFRLGKGMPVNRDSAIGWYRKAAAQGHTGAQDALGIMLFTKGERKQAIPLIQAAAVRGDPRALYILGTAHFNGDYVPRDYPRAYAEIKRAAAAGLPEAQRNLAKMEPFLTPDDRAKAVAILAGRDLPPAPASTPAPALAPALAQPAPIPVAPAVRPAPPLPAPPAPRPAVAASAAPIVTAPRPPPVAAPAVRGGRWRVQLGAYRSAAQAENQWAVLAGRVPEIAKLPHAVMAAGEFWRLQASGIADRATADALCRRVAGAGGACFTLTI